MKNENMQTDTHIDVTCIFLTQSTDLIRNLKGALMYIFIHMPCIRFHVFGLSDTRKGQNE